MFQTWQTDGHHQSGIALQSSQQINSTDAFLFPVLQGMPFGKLLLHYVIRIPQRIRIRRKVKKQEINFLQSVEMEMYNIHILV